MLFWHRERKKECQILKSSIAVILTGVLITAAPVVKCDAAVTPNVGVCAGGDSVTAAFSEAPVLPDSEYYGILNPKPRTKYQKYYWKNNILTTEEEIVKEVSAGFDGAYGALRLLIKGNFKEQWEKRFYQLVFSAGVIGHHLGGVSCSYAYNDYTDISEVTISPVYRDGWKAVALLRYSDYNADDTIKELLATANAIVEKAVASSDDLKDRLLYINNAIGEKTRYDRNSKFVTLEGTLYNGDKEHPNPEHDATGALLSGLAVCDGYSAAYELCLNILGVDNYLVTSKNGEHIWNRVKVDGEWLNVDVTWNDGGVVKMHNDYFLLTDEEFMEKTKEMNESIAMHTAFDEYLPE
jgi:transglutaminase/protease-like cytokinesis protein 3